MSVFSCFNEGQQSHYLPTFLGKKSLQGKAQSHRVYLDHNATTPLLPEAFMAMVEAMGHVGNPSSIHGWGRRGRAMIEEARDHVAALVGAKPEGVIFTSGGSEANALVLAGHECFWVSAIEHASLIEAQHDKNVLPVDRHGLVTVESLSACLAKKSASLIAIMLANNETGAIQPIPALARIAHEHGAWFHCDAVQAAGRIPVDIKQLGADSLALSAHKLGGPMGVGALVLADPDQAFISDRCGGGQERGRRAGTENLIGIVGFGQAACWAAQNRPDYTPRLVNLRDDMEVRLQAQYPHIMIAAAEIPRLPQTSCLALPGRSAQIELIKLDLAGIAVSTGSACSSGRISPSHVLTAMGWSQDYARSAIRVSLGHNNTRDDIDYFLDCCSHTDISISSTITADYTYSLS